MNTDKNQTSPPNEETLPGSGPDRVTSETPVCPIKEMQCCYWADDGCPLDICWKVADGKAGGPVKE